MNKKFILRYIIFLFTLAAITVSCNRNMEKMAEEYKSGVVLVQTREFYEMKMSNGNSLYFAASDFDKTTGKFTGLMTDLDSIAPDIFYGTGFFISDDGKIATNRHVVEGDVREKDVRMGLKKIIGELVSTLEEYKEEYTHCKENTVADMIYNPDTIQGLMQAQKEALELFTQRLLEINELLNMLKQNDPSDLDLIYHNDVRIAYNNTFVGSFDEFKPCTIRKKSENDDLAIIQLNTKQTPKGKHIFKTTPRDMLQHYSFGEFLMHIVKSDKNEKLMMIGFNNGLGGAVTEEGLSAQHPTGAVSRYVAEEHEVQYSIPALKGSSGSPVLNRRGQLVAINYASADTVSDRFNYGVKEKFLYELNKKK